MTDEDSPETPGEWPEYDSGLHADVKAVISPKFLPVSNKDP